MPTEPRSLHVRTPLWRSLPISRAAGCPVSLKMEALQPDGSFKIRGIGRLCAQVVANGTRHLVSASGGNAGISTASAARELGVRATIFVFDGVPPTALERIRDQGAEVVQAGATWADANRAAIRAAEAPDSFYVHPFDHPEIWTGHSTLVDEIVADGLRPSHMVLAVGGGGLLAGVLQGLDRHGLQDAQIIAVETEGKHWVVCAENRHFSRSAKSLSICSGFIQLHIRLLLTIITGASPQAPMHSPSFSVIRPSGVVSL